MDVNTSKLAVTIGARIRRERLARQWTLDRLAEAAGVSRRQVINVEQGEANPSIGTLLGLSDALGIGLPALVEPPRTQAVKITLAGEAATLWSGEAGGHGRLLAGTQPPDVVELWDWRMFPGESHQSKAHQGGTHELLHVRTGTLTLRVASESFELSQDDAISFTGDVPHSYANHGNEPTQFSLTVYEPQVGAAHGRKDTNE